MIESSDRTKTIEELCSIDLDLREFSENDLFGFINGTLLEIEGREYTTESTPEHPLLLLVGGPERDVSVARTVTGELIYKEPSPYFRVPEITGATFAISTYSKEAHKFLLLMGDPKAPKITGAIVSISAYSKIEPDISQVVSEITDVFYYLSHLTVLDSKFAEVYRTCLTRLSDSLGLPLRDVLLLTAAKYKYRYIDRQKKVPKEEDKIIAALLGTRIAIPSLAHLTATAREMIKTENKVLKPRLVQWRSGYPSFQPL